MSLGKRIVKVRKEIMYMTQTQFAKLLNTTRPKIAAYELDRIKNVDDSFLDYICVKTGVNSNWLKTGEGDWNLNIDRESEIIAFAQSIAMPGEESFKKEFLHMLSKLDEKDWETLEKIADFLSKEKS